MNKKGAILDWAISHSTENSVYCEVNFCTVIAEIPCFYGTQNPYRVHKCKTCEVNIFCILHPYIFNILLLLFYCLLLDVRNCLFLGIISNKFVCIYPIRAICTTCEVRVINPKLKRYVI
jgi:hypothetical protein